MNPMIEPLAQYTRHSCAECRRMKLKCNKKIPCSTCLRRGCASICPSGQLTTKGSRLILSNTGKLHDKIDALIARVHHLEDALEISHARYSREPHPLLREDLRRLATPADSVTPATKPGSEAEELTSSLGSFTLDGKGSRYFGSTGAFAYLWRDGDGPVSPNGPESADMEYKGETLLALSGIPPELSQMAVSLPISLPSRNTKHLGIWLLENCLPPLAEASSLFENYWEHFTWQYVHSHIVEKFIAVNLGRRPSYTFSDFDWFLPKDIASATPVSSIMSRQWPAFFIRDCHSNVLELLLRNVGKKEVAYSAISQLDAKIRDYPLPTYYQAHSSQDPPDPEDIRSTMLSAMVDVMKGVSLLSLHRRFFALALQDAPDDPLKSPFASSVLACCRSATDFLAVVRRLHSTSSAMTLRMWYIWPQVFVVTLILGSVVARSPGCSLASSALQELDKACQLWETTSESVRGANVMATVRKLKHRAFMAFAQARGPGRVPLDAPSGIDVSDEIAALGGGRIRGISPSPETLFPEQAAPSQSSLSSGALTGQTFTRAPVQLHSELGNYPTSTRGASSMPPPFDLANVDFSSFNTDTYPRNFDEVFQAMEAAPPDYLPGTGPTVLEEFGLGVEWQSVMDDLRL